MSKLEQLAKQRLLLRQDGSSTQGGATDNTKSASLLDKLKKSKEGHSSSPKLSLSERLQKAKTSHQSNVEPTPKLNTLSSKLHNLRNRNQPSKTDHTVNESQGEQNKGPIQSDNRPALSPEILGIKQVLQIFKNITHKETKSGSNQISRPNHKEIVSTDNFSKLPSMKHGLENLNSVYLPPAKKVAIETNFNNPSPDDVVIEAQTQAFTEVTSKVSNLSIKPPRRLQKKNSPRTKEDRIDIQEYMKKNASFPTLSVVTLGHEGSGKSTILGKMLYDLNIFNIANVNDLKIKLERSDLRNDTYLFWSWLLDYDQKSSQLSKKDIQTRFVKYGKYNYRFHDITGNKAAVNEELFKKISHADIGILTVDCGTDQFEKGFNSNGQILEHCILARTLGISHLIIAMSKLDTIDWYKERYMDIKRELQLFLTAIGFKEEQIDWVPCCSILNTKEDGIMKPVYNQMCPWNTNGQSIVDILQAQSIALGEEKKSKIDKSLVIAVDKMSPEQISGVVNSGNVQCSDELVLLPERKDCTIKGMWRDNAKIAVATPGDYISIKYDMVPEMDDDSTPLQSGSILTTPDNDDISIISPGLMMLDIEIFPIDESIVDIGIRWKAFINGHSYDIKVMKILDRQGNIVKVQVETTQPIIAFSNGNYIALRNKLNRTIGMGRIIL